MINIDEKLWNNLTNTKKAAKNIIKMKFARTVFYCTNFLFNCCSAVEKHCMNVGELALLHLHLSLSFLENCLINLMEYKVNTLKTILNL